MASKIYVDDIGTLIRVNCASDITGATTTDIYVKKPDGTTVTWNGAIDTDPNYLKYTVVSGDFDQAGTYKAHAYVETAAGQWTGEIFRFNVYNRWV
jgi:hypothetical protein